MSTFRYDNAALLFGTKQIGWTTDIIKALLVTGGYSALKGTDKFVADIPAGAIVVRSAQMTNCTIIRGVCAGLIPEFDALVGTQLVTGMALYKDTGVDATAPLIYYSNDGVGFPFLPAGINYFATYDQANGGWFQL